MFSFASNEFSLKRLKIKKLRKVEKTQSINNMTITTLRFGGFA